MSVKKQNNKNTRVPLNILILEDRESDADLMLHELRNSGYDPKFQRVETEQDYRDQLNETLDLIIADYNLPQFTGKKAIDILNETGLDIPLILVTGELEETALACLKQGAVDYLLKDRLGRLGSAVKKALEEKRNYDDKKLALEALRASEQRYRGVAETALTGIIIVDPKEYITYSNPAVTDMLGYSAEEMLGMAVNEIVDPESFDTVITQTALRKEGQSSQYEIKLVRKDGEILTVIASTSPITSSDGSYEGSHSVITDITERIKVNQALEESNEKLRLMVENSPIGFSATDLRGNILDVNPALCQMVGFSKEDLLSKDFYQITHPDDRENSQVMYQQLVEGKINYFDLKKRYIHKNGKVVHVLMRSQLTRSSEGKPLFEFALIENITAQVRAEKLLETLNRAALSVAQALTPEEIFFRTGETFKEIGYECIILTMDETRQLLKIKFSSYGGRALEAAESLVNFTQKDFSFQIKNSDVCGEVINQKKTVYIENTEGMIKQAIPAPIKKFAGKLVRILRMNKAIFTPLIMSGEVTGILTVQSEDLIESDGISIATFAHQVAAAWRKAQLYEEAQNEIAVRIKAEEERREIEIHLRQQQKLESIGTLASGVAHEINNPINGIMNYAQLIHDRLDVTEVRLREFSAGIIHETKRVTEIVSNLLTFSRQDKIIHSPAKISDIVNDTLSLIRAVFRRDHITLEEDIPGDLPKIKCHSQQIQQVLMNLLTNARDALNERFPGSDPGKIIAIRAKLFEKEGRKWMRITVEDHGMGIPPEIRERIFDPFYTTKARNKGTGLGLSISMGIVQDHHGELTFECEEDQPTRFHLDLPVDKIGNHEI